MVDPALLNLIASLLIVIVATRVVSETWALPLFSFGTYAMPAIGVAVLVLVLAGRGAEPNVFFFAMALVAGLYWTGIARDEERLAVTGHVVAAASAGAYALATALIAVWYRWWIAPLVLLLLMGTGLVVNGLVPFIRSWRTGEPWPPDEDPQEEEPRQEDAPRRPSRAQAGESAAQGTPRPDRRGARAGQGLGREPPNVPPSPMPQEPSPPDPTRIRCRECGLTGRIPPGTTASKLRCPRCGTRAGEARRGPGRPAHDP